ncbi:competence protein ComEA [Nocardioides ginsengisegetis]|uniref:Competence protein ComEA n=1 Tax=Nocardioides ginsengisegetis TaxID=661491 RepID=A0A7W3IXZ1_9ACTN|nr:ComEA family DNA-binding protein [Nocardioides ginsengisegetis]MBA8802712.1 competence protein ComEA [Nocardioides ginsengisegetis]
MRTRRPSPEHEQAVSRRLELLSAELAQVRPEPVGEPEPEPDWLFGHTRVPRREPPDLPDLPDEASPPPALPVPGRHASRRAGPTLTAAIPETLRGRVRLGPGQVAVVAVLVALGLAVTCWWLVRGQPSTVEAPGVPAPVLSSGTPLAGAVVSPVAAAGATATASGTVTVDVAGKVRRPGIVVLDAGSRVIDALKRAGGARPGVDLSSLNLARVLVDGEQILVGVPAPVGVAASAVPVGGAPPGPLVNLNTATQEQLETLPEVGPVTAGSIVQWRTEHGGFTSVDELLEVDGIGDATLGKLAPYVTV